MTNKTREEIKTLLKSCKEYACFSIFALIIFVAVFTYGLAHPQLILSNPFFLPLLGSWCVSIGGFIFTARKSMLLAFQAQNLEQGLIVRNQQNNDLVNEQMPELVPSFSSRLEDIKFREEIRARYIDPETERIMNYPYFIGCHNIDHPTYLQLQEMNEANRRCPHPDCKKPILFAMVARNSILSSKIEAYVALQEVKARAKKCSPLFAELKETINRRVGKEEMDSKSSLAMPDEKDGKKSSKKRCLISTGDNFPVSGKLSPVEIRHLSPARPAAFGLDSTSSTATSTTTSSTIINVRAPSALVQPLVLSFAIASESCGQQPANSSSSDTKIRVALD